MNIEISIIIPVYNAEKYLEQCVQSILIQTFKDFEVILIDDGSTDASYDICKALSGKDSRVKAVHKENGGVSSARNMGLDVAKGKYVTFMDNDDYWNASACLEQTMHLLKESGADILMHNSYIYWQDKDMTISPSGKCKRNNILHRDAAEALAYIISSGAMDYCVWSKIIKLSLIRGNNIYFPEGMRSEDIYFVGELLLHASSFDYCEQPFYVYRKGHEGAQTNAGITTGMLADLGVICTDYIDRVFGGAVDEKHTDALLSYIAFPYCVWMGQLRLVADKENFDKRQLYKMKRYLYILKYNLHPHVKIIAIFEKIFGFTITSYLLGIFIKKKNHLK